jgi:maleate isomerase
MLTPSSNTVLEPVTNGLLADLPGVSAHFSRFRVTEISLRQESLGQFDVVPRVDAARLLADAKVDVIAWNGTSASWLGIETDRTLCNAIMAETGIQATSTVLALTEILEATGVSRLGLVTPYTDAVQERIIANFAAAGIDCRTERHLHESNNFAFARISEDTIAGLVRDVARDAPDGVVVLCTNMRGAGIAERLERETGVPVYDTVAVTVWKCLKMVGVDTRRVRGWGGLFQGLASVADPVAPGTSL